MLIRSRRFSPGSLQIARLFSTNPQTTENAAKPAAFSIKGEALEGRPAYLDFQATTPLDMRVLDAMMPFLMERYGNPHSKTHAYGWETEQAIEQARADIAAMIGASPKEIIFTSGATEANNMSIKGGYNTHIIQSIV